jgi:hypothetical protein
MKITVILGLVAVVVALFTALVFPYRDRGVGHRVVTALAIRVGLSISVVAFLLFSYWMGWIS